MVGRPVDPVTYMHSTGLGLCVCSKISMPNYPPFFFHHLESHKNTKENARSIVDINVRVKGCAEKKKHPCTGRVSWLPHTRQAHAARSLPLVLSIILTFHSLLSSPAVKIQFTSPLEYKLRIKLVARTREVRAIAVYVHMVMIIKASTIFMAYK